MTTNFYTIILLALLTSSIACTNNSTSLQLTNPNDESRYDESVVITRAEIAQRIGYNLQNQIPIVSHLDENLPSQVDDLDQDGEWDELAFVIDLNAKEIKNLNLKLISKNEAPTFKNRTNIRFGVKEAPGRVVNQTNYTIEENDVPTEPFERFQMDGPAWENDKVGFRQYIDGRNAKDLYGKRTAAMSLDSVGISQDGNLEDNYHVLLPWGRDILAVGTSLGIGGIGIHKNDTSHRLGITLDEEKNNVRSTNYQLISEGPVRSIYTLSYSDWSVGNQTYDLKNTVTIWAGQYGYTNSIQLTSTNETDTLLVGLSNINNNEPPTLIENHLDQAILYTFDKQTYDKEYYLGMALIFPNSYYIGYEDSPKSGNGITNTYLNMIRLQESKSFDYHVLASWELDDLKISTKEAFDNLVHHFVSKQSSKAIVSWN